MDLDPETVVPSSDTGVTTVQRRESGVHENTLALMRGQRMAHFAPRLVSE